MASSTAAATIGIGLAANTNIRSAAIASPSGSLMAVILRGLSECPTKPTNEKAPSAPDITRSTSTSSINTATATFGWPVPDTTKPPSGSNRISVSKSGAIGAGSASGADSSTGTGSSTASISTTVSIGCAAITTSSTTGSLATSGTLTVSCGKGRK